MRPAVICSKIGSTNRATSGPNSLSISSVVASVSWLVKTVLDVPAEERRLRQFVLVLASLVAVQLLQVPYLKLVGGLALLLVKFPDCKAVRKVVHVWASKVLKIWAAV